MGKTWLIDSRSISNKVKNATLCPKKQIRDSTATRECPKCHHWIDNSDVSYEWPGLPVGVKFDPSDVELLDHLAARCGVGNAKPHMFIDDFIPTLEEHRGICYTHPKNLPGVKKDGSSIHFFHKTANAYASGQRKRRKIETEKTEDMVRWHKTGRTKQVVDMNGIQKGYKKIMVLYKCSKKGSKSTKSNWVMHQFHLGAEEDEKEGEYVVSKIMYQLQKEVKDKDANTLSSTAPNTPIPNPPRPGSSRLADNAADLDRKLIGEKSELALPLQPKEDYEYNANLGGESQAAELNANNIDDSLLCKEMLGYNRNINDVTGGCLGTFHGIPELDNLDFDTPPDFSLADLQFSSQDSIFSWLDRL